MPFSKKRRVTVSGPQPQPLRIDVRPNPEQPASTPISPVVMGFKVQRDNPNAMEQVRSMITVKQKQKALIEQRRGSVAGLMSPVANTPPTPVEERNNISSKIPPPSAPSSNNRTSRRSPNTASGVRRLNNSQSQRVPSPQPSQQQTPPSHSLPPPPISFARRRAAQLGAKKKPADILISPREAHTQDQLQPSIQSAPPIPQAAGQSQFYPTRFTMALPRLPATVIGSGDNVRRITGHVPPTPTRLSMQHNSSTTSSAAPGPLRSPTAPSVPIASTLVPPTPTSLHRLGYSGEKSAFLAPFEVFYDALNDSKQLKTWLGEQLQKSHSLMQSLSQQQDRINDTVDNLVEKRIAGMKSEMTALRRRVEDLEDSLRTNNTTKLQNGQSCGAPVAPESYSFPSIPAPNSHDTPSRLRAENSGISRRLSSPVWGQERDREGRPLPQQQQQHAAESDNLNGGSSAPYEAKRLSATRLDPPRVQHSNGSNMQSPSQGYREHSNNIHNNHNNHNGNNGSGKQIVYPPTPTSGHLHHPSSRDGPSSRQNASLPTVIISGESQRDHDSGSGRRSRVGSRRNSIAMSGPDGES